MLPSCVATQILLKITRLQNLEEHWIIYSLKCKLKINHDSLKNCKIELYIKQFTACIMHDGEPPMSTLENKWLSFKLFA